LKYFENIFDLIEYSGVLNEPGDYRNLSRNRRKRAAKPCGNTLARDPVDCQHAADSLESEPGLFLFQRRKSVFELTSVGFRLQRYAQLMIDTWCQARQGTALPAISRRLFPGKEFH
jgi:hypothetical protein